MERRSAESKDAFTCPPERFSISAAAREQKALDRSLQGGNIFSNGDQDVQSESSGQVWLSSVKFFEKIFFYI